MKNKKIIIISIIIALLIIAGILVYLFLIKDKKNEPKTYVVSFNTDHGSEIAPIKLECDKPIQLPENPTKEGYAFKYWTDKDAVIIYDNAILPCEDTTLVAAWEEIKEEKTTFEISFVSDGGIQIDPITLNCGETLKLPPAPTREGYTFKTWYDRYGTPILDGALLSCEDVTLKAAWEEIKKFKVTFDSKGGSSVSAVTVECGKTLKLPSNPTKSGYTFGHWEDKFGTSILDGALFTCEGDFTLYAVWDEVEKKYTCPSGYELYQETKCLSKVDWTKKCSDGWKEVNGECVNPSSPNPKGTRVCPSKTYNGWTGTGTYYEAGRGYCGYQELPSYTGNKTGCEGAKGSLAPNNHCYKHIEISYTTECASGEKLFAAQVLAPGNGGGCYQVAEKKITCESGYSMNYTLNKCTKIIDATLQ